MYYELVTKHREFINKKAEITSCDSDLVSTHEK